MPDEGSDPSVVLLALALWLYVFDFRPVTSSDVDKNVSLPGGGREARQYCDGPCPADCGEVLDATSGCYRCQCGAELHFGDVLVAIDKPCPAGLTEGQSQFATKVCLGQGETWHYMNETLVWFFQVTAVYYSVLTKKKKTE